MGFRSAAGSLPVIGMADGTQMRSRLIAVVVKVAMSTRSQLDASLVIVAVLSTFRSNVVTRLTCRFIGLATGLSGVRGSYRRVPSGATPALRTAR